MSLYLVTGGCGFIGSHLCDALMEAGHEVRVLDDLSAGSPDNLPRGAMLLAGSVADPKVAAAAIEGVDGCFHLAAIASVERCTGDWLGAHRTNLSGTIAIFDAARRAGRRPIPVVYASSAAVYGESATLPIFETAEAQPRSSYGADKYGCELHARIASRIYAVPTVGLRFFNVYGPRQNPESPYSGVISIFCSRLQRGEPIDIFGDGSQTRDFVFVSDVTQALLSAMQKASGEPAIFNVCSGVRTSVLELARLIGALHGRQADIRFQPPRPGDIAHSWGNGSLARRHLGLPRPIVLRAGLAATLAGLNTVERNGN